MRLAILTPSLSSNSLGRAYCLYLLARSLGWEVQTLSVDGDHVWTTLGDDAFAGTCQKIDWSDDPVDPVTEAVKNADLIVSVKPFRNTLGIAYRVHQNLGTPLLADIDDPDLEVLLAEGQPLRRLAKTFVRRDVIREAYEMRDLIGRVPRIVSNPELARRYGGSVVPHVRPKPSEPVEVPPANTIDVAFVGTVRPHKGIAVLRKAVRKLAGRGYRLTVTADPPKDALPHERWVGQTTLEAGLKLTANASIVAIPSLSTTWSRGQLPVKLVDAMLAGTCVVVSDIDPLPWAVGDFGLTVKPGSVASLVAKLEELYTPESRTVRRQGLYEEALRKFTVESNSERFRAACVGAMRGVAPQ